MGDVHCLDSPNSEDHMKDESLNISDVIEVIETDPDFKPSVPAKTMFAPSTSNADPANIRRQAVVRIVEQPASKKLRFRYECEGRSAGSIPGINSTSENKTFPSIQILGYTGKAVVVVSCVTKDAPYRPHPHNLVGREGCRKGVCTLEIPQDTMSITFSNLGIQCVKKKDIESHLKIREEIRVDPFKTGFHHRNQPTSIDLNAVRLCFQVFTEGRTGKFSEALDPVVSDPIYDKKAMSDLVIVKLSDCVSTVDGGRKDIILLCEKVTKEDIQIRFFEEKNGECVWEGFGDFQPSQVHKQTSIWFKTPRYKTLDITEPVKVFIQLRRPSDGATSEALPFEFLPLDSGIKRKMYDPDHPNRKLLRPSQEFDKSKEAYGLLNNIKVDKVKLEPREQAQTPYVSPTYVGNLSPIYTPNPSISPHSNWMNAAQAQPQQQDIQFNIIYPPNNNLNPINQSNVLPPISNVLSQYMTNIPSASNANNFDADNAMNVDNTGLSSLLNMDNQQLQQINLNSDDLTAFNTFDTNNLSESFTNNLSISEGATNQNMTDSLTRLAQTTYDNMVGNNIP